MRLGVYVRVDVKPIHIEKGHPGEPALCPVRHAIVEATGQKRVRIDSCDAVWLSDKFSWLPADEMRRIQVYDRTGQMLPHSFELDVGH